MKTGIELIAQERKEQIRKHGFTKAWDRRYNGGELVQGALCTLEKVGRGPGFTNEKHPWPGGWSTHFNDKIRFKDDVGKLIVAGAFYMAENDRLKEPKYEKKINQIAKRIDKLLKSKTLEKVDSMKVI